MDAVKGAGQNQVVIGSQLLQARSEGPVKDEPTGLVDDKQSKDDPTVVSVKGSNVLGEHAGLTLCDGIYEAAGY